MAKLLLCTLVLLSICRCALSAADDALIPVEAEGTAAIAGDIGRAEDEALADAKRNAVEQAVGVFVKSETVGANYKIIRDSILTRSEGYIAKWERIDGSRRIEQEGDDRLLRIRIRAEVGLVKLVDELSDIEEVYNQMQRPRIAVRIDETNLGKPNSGVSSSGLAVIRALKDRGFEVVDDSSSDAEILLVGSAESYKAELPDGISKEALSATARLDVKMVYVDTGEILFAPGSSDGSGIDFHSREKAGLKALRNAGERLISGSADRFASDVLARWALEVQNGRVFRVTAEDVSYEEYTSLKRTVLGFRGTVGMVRDTYESGTATLDVRSTLPPDVFRERLMGLRVGDRLRIVGAAGSVTKLASAAPVDETVFTERTWDEDTFYYPPTAPPKRWRKSIPSSTNYLSERTSAVPIIAPEDLDLLALTLRKTVNADPAVRDRMAKSRIAISSFELIDVGSPSMARSVAEDLCTAMIRSGFDVVAHGRLDDAMREIKTEDSALIDPSAAQKIGRLSGCDVVLLGSISDRGGRYVVNARLVDTATGKSIAADRLEVAPPRLDGSDDDHWVVTLRASARD